MDRKQDTRQKIQLGGLVVKAGLRQVDKAVILAILMEGAKAIANKAEHERLRLIGRTEFQNDDQTHIADADPDHSHADSALGVDRH